MKRNSHRWIGALAAVTVAAVLVAVTVIALTGATSQEDSIGPADTVQMRQYLDDFWAARQATWPQRYQGTTCTTLPAQLKRSLLASSRPVIGRVTTGRMHEFWISFDPGAFLEEQRASGSVITSSGYEIVSMAEPVLVSEKTAQVDVTVRSWGREYEANEDGTPKGDPYTVTNDLEYRYTFQKVGDVWRISKQDLLSNPT